MFMTSPTASSRYNDNNYNFIIQSDLLFAVTVVSSNVSLYSGRTQYLQVPYTFIPESRFLRLAS